MPSLLPRDVPLSVTFSFADTAKDGVLNGQWAIENPEHTSGVRGPFLFNPQTKILTGLCENCLLYTSPSPRDRTRSRMPSSA